MNQWFESVWSVLLPFKEELIGLGFTLLAASILYAFRAKVKLHYGRANNSRNVVFSPQSDEGVAPISTEVFVDKYFLQNIGRKVATNVEFVLSNRPNDIMVWQPRDAEYKTVEKGNLLVKIPQISPGELVIIDCLYLNQQAAFVASVKCAEAMGKEVPFWTLRRFPPWFNGLVLVLLLFGVAFTVQIIISLVGS